MEKFHCNSKTVILVRKCSQKCDGEAQPAATVPSVGATVVTSCIRAISLMSQSIHYGHPKPICGFYRENLSYHVLWYASLTVTFWPWELGTPV